MTFFPVGIEVHRAAITDTGQHQSARIFRHKGVIRFAVTEIPLGRASVFTVEQRIRRSTGWGDQRQEKNRKKETKQEK